MRYVVDIDRSDARHMRGTVMADGQGVSRAFIGWLELISILERAPQSSGATAVRDDSDQQRWAG
jgi:hypothetical protein